MKKLTILSTLVSVLMVSTGMAQNGSDMRDNVHFGLKAGLNLSNVYDENNDDFTADSKVGFVGGAFLRIPIGRYLGLQPEFLFAQKGFKGEGSFLGSSYSFTRTTNHFDIPLQLAFKPVEAITILAGPQYSYVLSRKDDFNSSLTSSSQEEEFDNDNIRRNILGIVAGLDINVNRAVIGLRLGWDVQNNHGDGSSSTPRYKNAWFQGTLGLAL